MMKSISSKHRISGLIALFLLSSQAMANTIGVGIGVASEFPGSGDYEALPNGSFEIDTPVGILKNNQIGVQLDLIKSTSIDTGPIIRANFGRNDDISDSVVARLDEVDTSAELGWFVGSGVRLDSLGIQSDAIIIGRLNAVTDVGDGHGGTQIYGSAGLVLQLTDKFRIVPSVGFNYVDDNYSESFYSVSSAGAQASGLNEFSASAGLEFMQVALFALREIDSVWSVSGALAFNALQGDAEESPITQRGTADQVFAGFAVNYKF